MQDAIAFLSGKKSYLVSLGAIVYALGINRHWWSHQPDIDLALGGTYGITIRAALKKLYLSILASRPIVPGSPLMRSAIAAALIPALCLTTACSTTQLNTAAAMANSPAGQVVIKTAVTGIMVAGTSALSQYSSTGTVTGRGIAQDELYTAQQATYSLMGTPQVNSSTAIINAVSQGGPVGQAIAPTVAANVKAQINQGIAPDIAVQKAADALGTIPTVDQKVQNGAAPQTTVSAAAATIAAAPVVQPTPTPSATP